MLDLTPAADFYRDPAIFERERETIFARTWQFLGLEADLSRVGNYLAEVLAGYPVVVVRESEGGLRGFHNVCRHRAGPLVREAIGRCDREFVCRSHAWRYGFDGRLKDAPGFAGAETGELGALSLFPLRVEVWRGLVFVNFDLEAGPLAESLAPLDAKFGGPSRWSARLLDHHDHPIACNWKVYVENYLDGYRPEEWQIGPSGKPDFRRPAIRIVGDVAFYEGPGRGGGSGGLWAWIWPNLGLTVYHGVLQVEHMRPDGPDRTLLAHSFLHEPEDPGVDAAMHAAERIIEDDAWICERVQQNLDAGVYRRGVLSSTDEGAIAWFQQRVSNAIAS